ncbi:uncharacterized protein LOC143148349 [Ptiloglossa arizonensis]|uniref:uncharacterized protein LOC143148349 n=1 Tax=Ptiloglossa arizonensis TaxID=3350558 RepID=UPI003F9EFD6F
MMLRHLKMIKFMYHTNISYLLKKNSEINRYIYNFFPCQVKNFNSSHRSHLKISEKKEKKVGLKSTKDSKIMLIHPDESESVVLLEEAEKLAKRRNLRLEKVETDIHAERDQYKLIDSLENIIQNEKLKTDETNSLKLKATKLFIIQSKITIHDINIKLRNINKSLEKNFKVKIMIFYSENIKDQIVENVKKQVRGNLLESRLKKNSAVLIYTPIDKTSNLEDAIDNNKKINSKTLL